MYLLSHSIFSIFLKVGKYITWFLKIQYIIASLNIYHFNFAIALVLKKKTRKKVDFLKIMSSINTLKCIFRYFIKKYEEKSQKSKQLA